MTEQEIYIEATSRPDPVERSRFLDEVCGNDKALRNRLEKLIRHAELLGDFLVRPPEPLAAVTETALDAEGPGTQIGLYTIREQIGEGGFAVVYVAEQTEPIRRQVALKIIKQGMDTRQVIARFEAEQQALAMMDHPGIAEVYDAGATETGRPYFVMQLIRGVPITEFCDQNKLNTEARLRLFLGVCHAVQHAHQKGIIHRDIKPSNVLIALHDGRPMPKVIDFGVAKATHQRLTEKTLYTSYRQIIGTPLYMSPEQAEFSDLDIDTRSDIYSLGVLLYELLTGTTPFKLDELKRMSYDEICRTIRDSDPPAPSRCLSTLGDAAEEVTKNRRVDPAGLRKLLCGDLDCVVMKCLEKDRTRRYATAGALAADVERHLENEPVVARAPSALYRLQRAYRRHRIAFAAVAAVVAALVAGTGVSTWQAIEARSAQRETRRLLYASDMIAAQQAWATANLGRATELLDRYKEPGSGQEDLRGFAWYYLWRLCQRGLKAPTLPGDAGYVWCVAFSPDGKTLATGSNEGIVKVWEVQSRELRHSFTGDSGIVLSVCFSPDGETLATAGLDGAKLWDPTTGDLLRTINGLGGVVGVAISSTGKLLAACLDGTVRLCDLPAGQPRIIFGKPGGPRVWSVAIAPDGNRLAFGLEDGTVWLGDVNDREGWKPLKGHTSWARSLAFSPDGKCLASASHDHTVKLWDAMTGEAKHTFSHRDRAWSVAFSPDSETLASTSNSIRLWDVETGRELDRLIGHQQWVYAVAFSRGGILASGSHDTKVKLWDLNEQRARDTLTSHINSVWDVAVSHDGGIVASASEDGTVKLWDVATGEELNTLAGHSNWVECVAFSHDDKILASGGDDGRIKLWEVQTGKDLVIGPERLSMGIVDLAFSPDGKTLASAGQDSMVRLWDIQTGHELKHHKGQKKVVWDVAFSPDGKTLAWGSDDKTIKVWDLDSDREPITLKGHTSVVNSLAFSPEGTTLASGSGDGTVKLWDAKTWTEQKTLTGHRSAVWSVAFSSDGNTLASSSHDTTIKLWDLVGDRVPETLIGHSSAVQAVVFTPDGNALVSGSGDGTVKIWRRATADQVAAALR